MEVEPAVVVDVVAHPRQEVLVEEPLRHVRLEARGEDLGGPEDGGRRPLVRLRDAQQLLPVPVLRDHLEELGHLAAPVNKERGLLFTGRSITPRT